MAEHAHVVENQIIDIRDIDLASVPEHKQYLWRPVVYEGSGNTRQTIIEADKVRVVHSMSGSLDDVKLAYSLRVDAEAEAVRMKYLTPGYGMALTYREKLEQAEQVAAQDQAAIDALTSQEEVAAYPTLSASVGVEASTLWDCAQLVLSKYQQWALLSHEIERIRMTGKKAISEADTAEAVQAAYSAIDWGDL